MREMKNSMEEKLPSYGGQALIEGVMMRGTHSCAMAVRAPDQSIVVETEELGRIYQSRIAQLPFVRGLITLWDALALGIRALVFSANIQAPENEKIEGRMLALTLSTSQPYVALRTFDACTCIMAQNIKRSTHSKMAPN